MTKREMREMENKIRLAMEEPYNPTDERIEEIKQNAFKAYELFLIAQAEKPTFWQRVRNMFQRRRN